MRHLPGTLGALVAGVVGILGITVSQPELARRHDQLRTTTDFFALPAPNQVVVASLGYRAAVADVLYANTLVAYGNHFAEKRRFEFAARYLDTILALDPKFHEVYYFADAILTLQPEEPRMQDYVAARRILEKGTEEFPTDPELWLSSGQFMAYVAPGAPVFRGKKELIASWRLEGARRMARSCSLIDTTQASLPYHCLSAAGLLSKQGDVEASIRHLERLLAVVDDPNVRRQAEAYLARRYKERAIARGQTRAQRLAKRFESDLGFVSKDLYLTLPPPASAGACAGRPASSPPTDDCAATWWEWSRAIPAVPLAAKKAPAEPDR